LVPLRLASSTRAIELGSAAGASADLHIAHSAASETLTSYMGKWPMGLHETAISLQTADAHAGGHGRPRRHKRADQQD
jgi:hypothetical protein